MHILITGNMGYIGSVLVRHLRGRFPDAEITGFDSGYFAHCLTGAACIPETALNRQIFGDVRDVPMDLVRNSEIIIHLAAISNDPMGNRFEAVTEAINYKASLRLAEQARVFGVGHFVFASSCSVYGFAEGGPRKENDPLDPLTAYARSKIAAERGLSSLQNEHMTITCLRFGTACGMSGRLRLDLVVNDFVACALSSGEITVLSDGTPWRPLIDIADMARAVEWAMLRPSSNGGSFLAVNVGSDSWNRQVCQLAEAVVGAVPGTKVFMNANAPSDKRSYKVDFSLYRSLAPDYQPRVTLADSVAIIRDGLRAMGFADRTFRQSALIRLRVLEAHMEAGRLDADLRWQRQNDGASHEMKAA